MEMVTHVPARCTDRIIVLLITIIARAPGDYCERTRVVPIRALLVSAVPYASDCSVLERDGYRDNNGFESDASFSGRFGELRKIGLDESNHPREIVTNMEINSVIWLHVCDIVIGNYVDNSIFNTIYVFYSQSNLF
ncbi:hypothetical protein QE152_g11025 [Popillia japonica]|uniref:Uncharacterized protein n=1 Tax=Popillia japonica TaxID=7064 RepID=A0AAW1LRT7_POPJA